MTASLADYADTSSVYWCGGKGDDGPQHDAVKDASKRGRARRRALTVDADNLTHFDLSRIARGMEESMDGECGRMSGCWRELAWESVVGWSERRMVVR